MDNRRPYVFAGITVFMVAVAMRTIPLYWSYFPFNLDGFQFAAPARYTLDHGYLPFSKPYFQPDKYSFSVLLTIVSQLTGTSPLRIAQPLIAIIGSVPCLVAVILVRQIGLQHDWPVSQTRLAAAVAGLVLAVEGIYLGRSAAVTSEGAGIVIVALLALVFYRALTSDMFSWKLVSVMFVLLLPLTHVLATIEGALVVTTLLALSVRRLEARALRFGSFLVALFWLYLVGYYSFLNMGLTGRLATYPGLFVAWLIVLVIISIWIPTAATWLQRGLPLGVLLIGCIIFILNSFVPVFPGTAETPSLILLLTGPVALCSAFASWGLPYVTNLDTDGEIVVSLLIGPLILIGFALTGGLTVEYQAIAVRGQIFLHLAAVVLAAISVVAINFRPTVYRDYSKYFMSAFIPFLLIAAIVSSPLAFLGLHATPAQPVTAPNEFEATTFATTHIHEQWISDGQLSRLSKYYYPTRANTSYTPVYQWLRGGSEPPRCTVVSQQSWTTVGAQLFPASPKRLEKNQYQSWLVSKQVIYSVSGDDPVVISRPSGVTPAVCHS